MEAQLLVIQTSFSYLFSKYKKREEWSLLHSVYIALASANSVIATRTMTAAGVCECDEGDARRNELTGALLVEALVRGAKGVYWSKSPLRTRRPLASFIIQPIYTSTRQGCGRPSPLPPFLAIASSL
jgi:hypothetical protein